MRNTSRSRQPGRTLRSRVVLPAGGAGAAQHPAPRPAPRRLPARATDVVLALAALLLAVWNSVLNPALGPGPAPWANLLLAAVSALPLLIRRRAPELVVAGALLCNVLQISAFVTPLAYYAEGAYRGPHSRRTVWVAAGAGLVVLAPWSAAGWSSLRTVTLWFSVNFVFACLVPLLLGLYAGQRRAVVTGLVERAERAEREQRLVAEAAREQERRRIAGEMHDVVSHQVSLIVVHANALTAVAHDPKVTSEAAQTIQTAGRRALTELREMLGVLRNGPSGAPSPSPGTGPEGTAARLDGSGTVAHDTGDRTGPPGTAVERITELADGSRAAGLPVTLHVEGRPGPLAEPVDRAAHRVVQEALTNVHKHAPGAATDIHLDFGPRTVRVRVVNGPPERPAAPAADGAPLLPSGGHGLIGLTERVRLAGGTIESGPARDGGFRIEAALPA